MIYPAADRSAQRCSLHDEIAAGTGQLRPTMTDHTEVRSQVLGLFRNVIAQRPDSFVAFRQSDRTRSVNSGDAPRTRTHSLASSTSNSQSTVTVEMCSFASNDGMSTNLTGRNCTDFATGNTGAGHDSLRGKFLPDSLPPLEHHIVVRTMFSRDA
ncbi:hypothetical protein PQR35_41660 [Paraburkholderia sediminicola]